MQTTEQEYEEMKRTVTKPAAKQDAPSPKLTHRQFVEQAIKSLRKPPHKGIHVVYSNFNAAFRAYFGEDPRPIVDKMVEDGFLVLRLIKGGALITLATDVVEKTNTKSEGNASATLAKILSHKS